MAIYDKAQRQVRNSFERMLPSERAKQGNLDYEYRKKAAEAAAKAENARRAADKKRIEQAVEDNVHRLVNGSEIVDLTDLTFLIGLITNGGEEDTNHRLLNSLDTHFERLLEQQVNKLRREYWDKRNELDATALAYFQKADKRNCKKALAALEGTPYESISKRVDAIVNGDKGE